MVHTWILVANSATARIFNMESNGSLTELKALMHPASRLHQRDLVSDREGRSFESAYPAHHALEPPTPAKQVEFAIFAKLISDHLNEEHRAGKFNKLYIAASPHFLGLLRKDFSPQIVETIAGEIDKDITHLPASEVKAHLFSSLSK
jgi:protein required for attachment to host cells